MRAVQQFESDLSGRLMERNRSLRRPRPFAIGGAGQGLEAGDGTVDLRNRRREQHLRDLALSFITAERNLYLPDAGRLHMSGDGRQIVPGRYGKQGAPVVLVSSLFGRRYAGDSEQAPGSRAGSGQPYADILRLVCRGNIRRRQQSSRRGEAGPCARTVRCQWLAPGTAVLEEAQPGAGRGAVGVVD